MPLQKYINNISSSSIAAIYTYLESPKPRFIIEYKDQTSVAHKFQQIIDLLNKSKSEPAMALTDELREAITTSSDNIISKDESANKYFLNDIEKFQSLHFGNTAEQSAQNDDEKKLLSFSTTHMPWFKFHDNFTNIVSAAHEMLKANPGARIFSLGQSPAWVVKAAEFISALKHTDQTFGYIPFSGGFYQVEDEYEADMIFNPDQFTPTIQQKELYHNILDELGLSPKVITENYKLQNSKTAIMEFINTGKGLASFLSILFSWAKQEGISVETLNSALDIVLLVTSEDDTKNSLKFDDVYVECKNQIIEGIWDLANGVDSGIHSDRIIPNYPYSKWDNAPAPIVESSDFIKILMNKLQAVTQEYLSTLPSISDAPVIQEEDVMLQEAFLPDNNEINVSGNLAESDSI